MASFKFYLLSALFCGVLILGQAVDVTTETPTIIDITNTTVTEEPTTSAETTEAPPTTTSTEKPTTSSTTPSTTTPVPTTTPIIPTTTPITTTTPVPTTQPPTPTTPAPPKPIGPPDQGLWQYTNGTNVTCVIVQFAAQLNVTYAKPNTTAHEFYHFLVNVPANASVVSGNCNGTEQWLNISWPATADQNNSLLVRFERNDTTHTYVMKSLNVSLAAALFPNMTDVDTVALYHGVEWQTPLASSYRCTAPTALNMNAEHNIIATLTLSRLQEEAFRTTPGSGFSAARDCAGGDIPDAVPIAVGCALGGMVVVVLIAYLVARRRSASRGYLSM